MQLELISNSNSPSAAIQNLKLGNHVDLSMFKSFQSKQELLSKAAVSMDDDLLLRIIFFIKKTLTPNLFIEMMTKQKAAVHQCRTLHSLVFHLKLI